MTVRFSVSKCIFFWHELEAWVIPNDKVDPHPENYGLWDASTALPIACPSS